MRSSQKIFKVLFVLMFSAAILYGSISLPLNEQALAQPLSDDIAVEASSQDKDLKNSPPPGTLLKETPTQKVERFLTTRNLEAITPISSVRGNMSVTDGEHVVKLKADLPPMILVGKPKQVKPRPFIMVIPDQKAFLKLWRIIAPTVLASEPVSMPKIDFSKDKAVFVMPYEPRGGGKPASFRSASFHIKKQYLLLEFDETDILSANPYKGRIAATAVQGNPWYLGVFSSDELPKEPVVVIRDW